jgi:hypothetical protein
MGMENTNPHIETVRRAALPEVMFCPDIAVAVQLPVERIEDQAPSGYFGPCFYVDGRLAVLRDDFLETMTLRASRSDRAQKEVLPDRDGAGQ